MVTKVAVVTGGNKGIGYAIVRGLCKQLPGYDILLTARDEERGKAAVEKLEKEDGVKPKFFPLDITNQETIEKLKYHLKEKYGGLDILVNNAAIYYMAPSTAPFGEQAEVQMNTNFTGTLNVCAALFPLLRNGARVVHLSSLASTNSLCKMSEDMRQKFNNMKNIDDVKHEMQAFVEAAKTGEHQAKGYSIYPYGMSKVGVTVMTEIQQHVIDKDTNRSDIIVNSCCPGYVGTDMNNHEGPLTIEQGADTPIYLATLPKGTKTPKGNYLTERKIIDWRTYTK